MTPGLTRRTVLLGSLAAIGRASNLPDIPDELIAETYERAATQNVLASVNAKVFPGYFSVCADGKGFGYGNSYPSLDGHQLTDALLWLEQTEVAKLNWGYVKGFQKPDGSLPLAILPSQAGKNIGPKGYPGVVADNGGLYRHWVPGNPLAALASPTYIQNADVLFRSTLDRRWLQEQIASVNLAADFLAGLTTEAGAVKGGGYYVERPTRLDSDGVTQPHAIDAFRRAAALNRVCGNTRAAKRYEDLAARVRRHFETRFWVNDHFAEYLHPEHGLVDSHGLSDTNWAALAFDTLTGAQRTRLWSRIRNEKGFYFGGMPTGIVTNPGTYQDWEFSYPDKMDLAAMGRVWYLEAAARARMGDAEGLFDGIRRVCRTGRESGYYWRERYGEKGGYGASKYCEYPANLIRIMQRYVFGIELRLDGGLAIEPTVTPEFRERGFGQTIRWAGRTLQCRVQGNKVEGMYAGENPLTVSIRLQGRKPAQVTLRPSASPKQWSILTRPADI